MDIVLHVNWLLTILDLEVAYLDFVSHLLVLAVTSFELWNPDVYFSWLVPLVFYQGFQPVFDVVVHRIFIDLSGLLGDEYDEVDVIFHRGYDVYVFELWGASRKDLALTYAHKLVILVIDFHGCLIDGLKSRVQGDFGDQELKIE